MKRNYVIDFWRIIFAFLILMVHSNGLRPVDYFHHPFVGGYTAVEFFFIVTGYTMKQSAERIPKPIPMPGKEAVRLTVRKLRKLWPVTTFSIIALFLLNLFLFPKDTTTAGKQLILLVFDIFYLPMGGFRDTFYNVPLWYLSALMFILPLVYYCLLKYDDFFCYVLAPLTVIAVWGYYSMTYGALEKWDDWNGIVYIGIFRALSGLCGGIISYQICDWLKGKTVCGQRAVWLSAVEYLSYLIVIGLSYFSGYTKMDFIKAFLLIMAVAITFSEKGKFFYLFNKKLFAQWGIYGFILYATHWIIRTIVPFFMPDLGYYEMLPFYIGGSLMLAFLVFLVYRALEDRIHFR